MPRPTHPKLTKLDIYELASIGLWWTTFHDKRIEMNELQIDILRRARVEIDRRIKLCQIATARKERQS